MKVKKAIKENDTFKKEFCDTLNKLYQENAGLSALKYFLDVSYRWANINSETGNKPKVVMLTAAVPEELVIAAGAQPYWIIGGSLGSTAWSDDVVPRDTDPVSRSILGYINRPHGADYSDSLFIIPLVNDSMRKIAYELKMQGRKICLIDIPPHHNHTSLNGIIAGMRALSAAVSEHLGTRATRKSTVSAMKQVSNARRSLRRFLEVSRERTDIITEPARVFVQDSYYMTNSIDEWTANIQALTKEIESKPVRHTVNNNYPKVMLLGSPVFFPNYKIPFLIQDTKLSICDAVDYTSLKTFMTYDKKSMIGNLNKLIKNIVAKWNTYDASPAYIQNDVLHKYVSWLLQKGDIEGVVYHILKGQIEYDFELEHFEKTLGEYGIPIFRLETDYQYQDVEQLRIRMEAFCEMLVQSRYREVKIAS